MATTDELIASIVALQTELAGQGVIATELATLTAEVAGLLQIRTAAQVVAVRDRYSALEQLLLAGTTEQRARFRELDTQISDMERTALAG